MAEVPIKAAFEELGIEWKAKEHAVAMSVEEGLAAIGEWSSECTFASETLLYIFNRILSLSPKL